MGITTNSMVDLYRISLPSVGEQALNSWARELQQSIRSGARNGQVHKFILRDQMVIETKQIVVHEFRMGDVEDPDLYAAEPLYQWQKSDEGTWVMENSMDTPEWHRHADPYNYGHQYSITAVFELKKLTEYYLRFGKFDR